MIIKNFKLKNLTIITFFSFLISDLSSANNETTILSFKKITALSSVLQLMASFIHDYWFYLFIFCLLSLSVPWIYYFRIRKMYIKQHELEDIVKERTEIYLEEKLLAEKALEEAEAAKQQLTKLNSEIIEANLLKTNLFRIAVHDLKNPLIAIQGFAEYILEDHDITPDTVELLKVIKESADNMLHLVKDLLETAEIESGKVKFKIESVSINEVLNDVIKKNFAKAFSKNQRIHYDSNDNTFASSDKKRLDEVFENLLSNAIKYSPYGKNIYINAKVIDNKVLVSFKDEGPGLSESDMSKVFGKFEKLSARPTANESSTGLGLSIVKDLVEMLNGKVWVESEINDGAIFFVELPVTNVPEKLQIVE